MKRLGPVIVFSAAVLLLCACQGQTLPNSSSAATPKEDSSAVNERQEEKNVRYDLELPDDDLFDRNILVQGIDPTSGNEVIYDLKEKQKHQALRLVEALDLDVLRPDQVVIPARSAQDVVISIGPARFVFYATPIAEPSAFTGKYYVDCARSDREVQRAYVTDIEAVRAMDQLLHFKKCKTMTWEEAFPPEEPSSNPQA